MCKCHGYITCLINRLVPNVELDWSKKSDKQITLLWKTKYVSKTFSINELNYWGLNKHTVCIQNFIWTRISITSLLDKILIPNKKVLES